MKNRNALAWFLLVLALAVHVADEAATGFLPFYNDLVLALRERWAFAPFPVFTFPQWLVGLIIGLIIGLALTPFAAAGSKLFRVIMTVFGILMIGNGLAHLAGSVYLGYLVPGVRSAPLVLAAAVYVVWRGVKGDWNRGSTDREPIST